MTQSPLGQNPSGQGPFDEAGSGTPDIIPPYDDTPTIATRQAKHDVTSPDETFPEASASPSSGSRTEEARRKAEEVAGTAKSEVKDVAETAVSSGKGVTATAQVEAENVVAETKQQAASLWDAVRGEVGQQASTQQARIAEALHGLAKELGGMASSSQESGPLTDLAHQASRKGGEVAHWLQDREPADVLESVRSYARRRPGTFLLLCGLAGVVAGRLTRSTVANRTSLDSKESRPSGDHAEPDSSGIRANAVTDQVTDDPDGDPTR